MHRNKHLCQLCCTAPYKEYFTKNLGFRNRVKLKVLCNKVVITTIVATGFHYW